MIEHDPSSRINPEGPEPEARRQLPGLKALPLPRATARIFTRGPEGIDSAELDVYLASFLPPRVGSDGNLRCVSCEATLSGLFGWFEWTLRHGEGVCARCRYPARAYHYVLGDDRRFTLVLQYHPDDLEALR